VLSAEGANEPLRDFGWRNAREEELEEHFDSEDVVLGGLGEPPSKRFASPPHAVASKLEARPT
jgi:hypothetical protein